MGIKSSLTCDCCKSEVPQKEHFAQLAISAHEMKWEEINYDSPFRMDVEHVDTMENATRVMCLPCGKKVLKALERELRGKAKAKPESDRVEIVTYELVDRMGNPVDTRAYEGLKGELCKEDLLQHLDAARTMTMAGLEVILREVRT